MEWYICYNLIKKKLIKYHMIYLVKMFRICSDNAPNLFRLFKQCSECSESVLTLFILFRLCSDNVQNIKNLFRIFSKCSECSESVQNFQNLFRLFWEFLAQKLVYSEFLDFVVIGTWLLEPNAAPPCLSLLTRARICCMPKTLW